MRLDSQCILCLLKRHSETAAKYGDEEQVTAFTRELMHMICNGPVEMSAPFYTPGITKLFTEHSAWPTTGSPRRRKFPTAMRSSASTGSRSWSAAPRRKTKK